VADSYSEFHEIASVVQKLIWGSDVTVVHRPSSKGMPWSSGHLVCVKNMQR
jgi:hypothetical protein